MYRNRSCPKCRVGTFPPLKDLPYTTWNNYHLNVGHPVGGGREGERKEGREGRREGQGERERERERDHSLVVV